MRNQTKKVCAYAAIAAALTLSPLAAFGQASPATSPETTSQTTTTDRAPRNEHHNYGWIGLLGLLGLTGLMRKRDNYNRVDYTERTDDSRSTAAIRS